MAALGFGRFAAAGHDRGARVALRMALDHPEAVSRLAVLDIVPTKTIYQAIDQEHATTVWRYFFLTQPDGLPEQLIGADPQYYLHYTLGEWCGTPGAPGPEAVAEYARCFTPAAIHASCEDYRAGAGIDLIHDQADAARTLSCPVLALWSKAGTGRAYDVERIWAQRAPDLRGRALDCGHFLAEERPDETAAELLAFLTGDHPESTDRLQSPIWPAPHPATLPPPLSGASPRRPRWRVRACCVRLPRLPRRCCRPASRRAG